MPNSKDRNTREHFMNREIKHASIKEKTKDSLSKLKSMPTWIAVGICDNPETLKMLLEEGADIEARDQVLTADFTHETQAQLDEREPVALRLRHS